MLDVVFEEDPGLVISRLEAELLSKRPDTRRIVLQVRRLVPPQPTEHTDLEYFPLTFSCRNWDVHL